MEREEKTRVYNKTNGRCAYCGQPIEFDKATVTGLIPERHIAEFARRGKIINQDRNKVVACDVCVNRAKTLLPEEFKIIILRSLETVKMRGENLMNLAIRYGLVDVHQVDKIEFYYEKLYMEQRAKERERKARYKKND